jgi:CubicO group peptidase (beta-lactamase class C family)
MAESTQPPHPPGEAYDPTPILRRFQLDLADVERHQLLPEHLKHSRELVDIDVMHLPVRPGATPFFSFLYALNTERLAQKLNDLLTPCVEGYALQLRRNGSTAISQTFRWSKTKKDGETAWSTDTPMHLASVSKLITAMALVRLLDRRGISYDTPVNPYLPAYWTRGNHIDQLTFRHLLTHKSGLLWRNFTGQTGPCDYQSMKDAIADGSNGFTNYDYKNINFALCRVLLATINGDIGTDFMVTPLGGIFAPLFALRDALWDLITIRAYAEYVNDRVFSPSSVGAREFAHDDAALAYASQSDSTNGWNSGDLASACATVGWHLTVRELLRVMRTFRRAGTIMSGFRAERMLDNGFGIDMTRTTRIGTVFGKGGWWQNGTSQVEQSNAYLLPRSMELVVLCNSPSCGGLSVFNKVVDAIDDSIEFWPLSAFTSAISKVFGVG